MKAVLTGSGDPADGESGGIQPPAEAQDIIIENIIIIKPNQFFLNIHEPPNLRYADIKLIFMPKRNTKFGCICSILNRTCSII